MKTLRNKHLLLLFLLIPFLFSSCKKTEDFISEDKVENGIHYYPVILSSALFDTAAKQYINLNDTLFSPGQEVFLELDYFSQDSLSQIEFWAGQSQNTLQKEGTIPFQPPSVTKDTDTVFISYTIPSDLDTTVEQWILESRVTTISHFQTQAGVIIPLK